MPPNKPNNLDTQSGNVFVIIFIAVVLFGALGFTFSKSANKGTGNLTKQQAKVAAQDILNYARLVEGAVDRVRRNGCSETEISFDYNVGSVYFNSNSPPDKSCHIFDDNGGKIERIEKPKSIDSSILISNYQFVTTNANRAVPGIGIDDQADLYMRIRFDTGQYTICDEINKMVGVEKTGTATTGHFDPSDPGNSGWANSAFTGSFPPLMTGFSSSPAVHGKTSFCTGITQPYFFHVLLAR